MKDKNKELVVELCKLVKTQQAQINSLAVDRLVGDSLLEDFLERKGVVDHTEFNEFLKENKASYIKFAEDALGVNQTMNIQDLLGKIGQDKK